MEIWKKNKDEHSIYGRIGCNLPTKIYLQEYSSDFIIIKSCVGMSNKYKEDN